jgi:hypothetical protein
MILQWLAKFNLVSCYLTLFALQIWQLDMHSLNTVGIDFFTTHAHFFIFPCNELDNVTFFGGGSKCAPDWSGALAESRSMHAPSNGYLSTWDYK